jgi:hypothetical protein
MVANRSNPNESRATLTYNFAPDDRMWVVVDYCGVCVGTDSRLQSPIALPFPDDVSVLTFAASDLVASA